jgi:hypothetical protein
MSGPGTAVNDNYYGCFHNLNGVYSPNISLRDHERSEQSTKRIVGIDSSAFKKGVHYVVQHSHCHRSVIENRINQLTKEQLLSMIEHVEWDIACFKAILSSARPPELEGTGPDTEHLKKVTILTKEIGEDKAQLIMLRERFKQLSREREVE